MRTTPADLTAVAARRMIGAKQLSCGELLESCIARIEQLNPAVNAMAAVDFDAARQNARRADAAVAQGALLGPLHGLPVGIKDLERTAGLRTTWGSRLFADFVPARDDGSVARIRGAGAVIIGKTNVPEFGLGANTRNGVFGATGNAFDPTKSAAGSSGGSAVALALGMMPIASGSDTGGSLRNPAAFNGIVGFRPTPGLVPFETRLHAASGFPVLGPMARTVADLCLMLSAMVSDDKRDMLATTVLGQTVRRRADFALPGRIDLAGLRVAATADFGFAPTEKHIRRVFAARIQALTPLLGPVEDAAPDCSGTDEAFEILRAIGVLGAHQDKVRAHPELCGPNMHANVAEGLAYSAADVARALALQTQSYQRWQNFFDEYDVILSPAITISPRPWQELFPAEIDGVPTRTYFHWLSLAYAVTLVGHPAISLPMGVDEAGMPFGLQIVGPRGGDARVLAVAHAIEQAVAGDAVLARPLPDLAKLAKAPPIAGMPGFMGFD
jgi:Asp-tRNA(Asn)/Glu-tRNA(Gln) amidotransferase A subunit family amidase